MSMTTMTTTIPTPEAEGILKQYHGDLIAFMKAHFNAPSQDDQLATDNAGFIMTRIRALLATTIGELEDLGEERFGDPDLGHRVKEGVAKLAGWTFGSLSGLGSHGTSKKLRDQYLFLNGVSLGYAMLYTTEMAANGESEFATLLLDHLRQWNDVIVFFNRSLPAIVLEDLAANEEEFDKSRTVEIISHLQSTWTGTDPWTGEVQWEAMAAQ